MPCLSNTLPDMLLAGPRLEVLIGVSEPTHQAIRETGQEPPEPVRVRALIDTGASTTVIAASLVPRLGLFPSGSKNILTPSCADHEAITYDISLYFPSHNMPFPHVCVIAAPLDGQGISCLIGRDILSRGLLIYEGYANRFILSF